MIIRKMMADRWSSTHSLRPGKLPSWTQTQHPHIGGRNFCIVEKLIRGWSGHEGSTRTMDGTLEKSLDERTMGAPPNRTAIAAKKLCQS